MIVRIRLELLLALLFLVAGVAFAGQEKLCMRCLFHGEKHHKIATYSVLEGQGGVRADIPLKVALLDPPCFSGLIRERRMDVFCDGIGYRQPDKDEDQKILEAAQKEREVILTPDR